MSRLVVLLLALSVSLGAQGAPPAPVPANHVRLDLHVTRDGVEPDLQSADVLVLEDGVPQTIDSFERVDAGSRPHSVVVFLDTLHLRLDSAGRLGLVRMLDRLVGPADRVVLMTPDTLAADLTFGSKAAVLSAVAQSDGPAAGVVASTDVNAKEELYDTCYPDDRGSDTAGVAADLKARRRERLTLDALDDLVAQLRGGATGRTAVIAVTDGWRLARESRTLGSPARGRGGDPRETFGRRQDTPDRRRATGVMLTECDADRAAMAAFNHSQRLRAVVERANRSAIAFYPIYAAALRTAPTPPSAPPQPERGDAAARIDSLKQLAGEADGLPLLSATDTDRVLQRFADDRSGYLIAYRSTNARLDGRFRAVTVRVRQTGVEVRTRRGYRGFTAEELLAARGDAGGGAAARRSAAASVDPRAPFRVRTAVWNSPANDGTAAVWVIGELDHATRRELIWTSGADADVTVVAADGAQVAMRTVSVPAAEGAFSVRLPENGGLPPGEYAVRVRLRPQSEAGLPLLDTLRLIVSARPTALGDPVLWRRGPSTGLKHIITADPRFQRSERVRVEMPTESEGPVSARMLDRLGNPMQVPVQASTRPDATGTLTWVVADASLAPLAPGDYTIEVSFAGATRSADFKVVP